MLVVSALIWLYVVTSRCKHHYKSRLWKGCKPICAIFQLRIFFLCVWRIHCCTFQFVTAVTPCWCGLACLFMIIKTINTKLYQFWLMYQHFVHLRFGLFWAVCCLILHWHPHADVLITTSFFTLEQCWSCGSFSNDCKYISEVGGEILRCLMEISVTDAVNNSAAGTLLMGSLLSMLALFI